MSDLKELLELIEKSSLENKSSSGETSNYNTKIHYTVKKFIKEFNITAGPQRIHNYLIYFYYRQKFNYINTEKVNKIAFFKMFGSLFPRARIGAQRYYLLDPNSFDLSKETKKEAKLYDKEYTYRNKAHVTRKKNKREKKESQKQDQKT